VQQTKPFAALLYQYGHRFTLLGPFVRTLCLLRCQRNYKVTTSLSVSLNMQCACTGPRPHSTFADTAYREHRRLGWQRQSPRRNACPSWLELSLHRQPHRTARLNRVPQTNMQAFQRPTSEGSSDPAFSRLPVVDITAETVSTSGRGSDDDRDQQHKPNIVRRAVAAAAGLLQSTLQWMQAHLKPWKLFDRSALAALATLECCMARQHSSVMLCNVTCMFAGNADTH